MQHFKDVSGWAVLPCGIPWCEMTELHSLSERAGLQVLRGEEDPLELYDGEDDDEDFVLDWEELMGTSFDDPTAAGGLKFISKLQWYILV